MESNNSTDKNISRLALGTWAFGSDYWTNQKHTDSIKTIRRALAIGISSFDTAPAYGKGKAEQLLGQNTKDLNSEIIISTKSMLLNETALIKSINKSLKRLNRNYIDIFFIHWPKTGFDYTETLKILQKYKEAGIIKKIGLSNFLFEDLKRSYDFAEIDAVQYAYNLLWRKIEKEIVPFCQKKKTAIQAYSPLAQGLLTKAHLDIKILASSDRRKNLVFFAETFLPEVNKFLGKLSQIANDNNLTMEDLSFLWLKNKNFIDLIIIGARTRQQLEKNYKAYMKEIDNEIISEINNLSSELMKSYPESDNIFNHKF